MIRKILAACVLLFLFAETAFSQGYLVIGKDSTYIITDSLYFETDEVVVTGTRVNKKIIDIPYPVTRISNTEYRFEKKTSINDVLTTVPGVFMQSRYGNHDVRISIRGYGSRSNTGIRGVRILLDGIPESEPDGQTRIEAIDFQSVGSIEIVKGNSSSLYTNAPGGVVNFISDINFKNSFVTQFNEAGSFGLRRNGIKIGLRTPGYGLLMNYTYHNFEGFREHSQDYWHVFNTVLETRPDNWSNFQMLFYAAVGTIKLPGSLTQAQMDEDRMQAAANEKNFDFYRRSNKGRIAFRYSTKLDEANKNELEITAYGTIKYFERAQRTIRIFDRYGLGATARYINRSVLAGRENEFSLGGDVFYQTGPISEFQNISGQKTDNLLGLTDDVIANAGYYFTNNTNLYNKQLYLLLTGRYDNVSFRIKDQLAGYRSAVRVFNEFTPKAALNYKLSQNWSLYGSYGLSFDVPAGNELDDFTGASHINQDLQPQKSRNIEIGTKGSFAFPEQYYFSRVSFEFTLFNTVIRDEIVPFDINGDVFYRNSAKTNRNGVELGASTALIPGLNAGLSLTYSDFTYDEYLARSIDAAGITTDTDYSGNEVPSVPRLNASFTLGYNRLITENMIGFAKTQIQTVTGMYVNDANSSKTSDYTLASVTLGTEIYFDKFSLILSGGGMNLFDRQYIGFININATGGRFYEAGEPRNFFGNLTLTYRL
ncbi:MAG: TonB-dependent receptor [Ignavibacteriaceae bacterium]|nr:TonB-dependent receptor [Ignavibacteriaceae bacterium]